MIMPVMRGKDGKGPYFKWGEHGKAYHYKSGNKSSRERARKRAARQGRAIKRSQNMR